MAMPTAATLDDPAPLLRWLASAPGAVALAQFRVAEAWALAGIAALAREERRDPAQRTEPSDPLVGPVTFGESPSARFAYAVGMERVILGSGEALRRDESRTVTMVRFTQLAEVEPFASEVSRHLVKDEQLEDTRRTIEYVMRELLRNALQHAGDPLGGVAIAQRSDGGRHAGDPAIQVVVVDAGVGVQRSLLAKHPSLTDPEAALDRALWPHISGTFEEGLTGSTYNAGMGLFFIAEMTKLVGGRLVLASRGATLVLEGDRGHHNPHGTQRMLGAIGFPGTLVAFEMPAEHQHDYDAMIETIKQRAAQRTPTRATHRWLRFEPPPAEAIRVIVTVAAENTLAAHEYSQSTLVPRLMERKSIALDFLHFDTCTQSFVHALLFEAIRIAWALKIPLYVANARPAVRSALELLEAYALAG